MTSILKVDNIKDSADNQAISISGGVATFNNLPVNASAAGTAAFAARVAASTWAQIADGSILPFDNASTGDSFNTDGVFNTATYKFTAPATGVYMFWYAVYTAQNDATNSFSFLKNATRINTQNDATNPITYASSEAGDHIQNGTVILSLTSGDTMAVIAASASDVYYGHVQWGGCRLA
jgi:hypothetical protein